MMKSHSFWLVEPQLCVGERFEQIMMFGGFTVRVFFFARDITDIPNLGCYSYLLISWWFVFPMCVAHLLSS